MANILRPIITQFEITDNCNFFCPHCYHLDDIIEKRERFKVEEETLLKIAETIISNEIFNIVLTGGEPLLKKNTLKKLIDLFVKHGRNVSLNTNLSLIDDSFISYLNSVKINSLLISCPSTDPEIYKLFTGGGDYSVFESNLIKLIKNKIPFTINMVVNKSNLNSIKETAIQLSKLGVINFGATPMGLNAYNPKLDIMLSKKELHQLIYDLIWVQENLNMTIDIIEALPKCSFPQDVLNKNYKFLNRKCQAGKTVVTISCKGEVRPCAHNPNSYGNILDTPLLTIYENMRDWRDFTFIPEKCTKCKYLMSCFGGCRINAYVTTKDWNGEDFWSSEPLLVTNKKEKKVIGNDLNEETVFKINKRLIYRREDEHYLIGNRNINNLMVVNNELFNFIILLKSYNNISLGEIATLTNTPINNTDFLRVINTLLNNRFIFYV